jgi:hypothetical protein
VPPQAVLKSPETNHRNAPKAQSRDQSEQAASKIDLKRPLIEACRSYPLFDGRQPFAVHQLFLIDNRRPHRTALQRHLREKAGGTPVQFRILPLRNAFLRSTQAMIVRLLWTSRRRVLVALNGRICVTTEGCRRILVTMNSVRTVLVRAWLHLREGGDLYRAWGPPQARRKGDRRDPPADIR